jgi:hypothetical protein
MKVYIKYDKLIHIMLIKITIGPWNGYKFVAFDETYL